MGQFASSPLKDRLPLQRELLRKNYSNQLAWNYQQVEVFETAQRVLSNSSQMLCPFNPDLKMDLVVNTAKTTGLGYILFQFQFSPRMRGTGRTRIQGRPYEFLTSGGLVSRRKGLLG